MVFWLNKQPTDFCLFHYCLLQHVEGSSLCCMVRPCLFLSPPVNTKLKAFEDRSFLPIVDPPKAPAQGLVDVFE